MRPAIVLCFSFVLCCLTFAQQNPAYYQTGIPINSAQVPIPLGFVNALTGKAHLEIPITSVPERNGIPVTAKIIYDTYLVMNNGNGYLAGGWSGFIYGTEKERESVAWDTVQVACTLAQYPYGGNLKIYQFSGHRPGGNAPSCAYKWNLLAGLHLEDRLL